MLASMTTLLGEWPEPDDSDTVAQRLRMYLGDKKMSRSKLALASGVKRSTLSNKLDNESEFTIGEIMAISHAIKRSWLWILTGRDLQPPDDGSRLGESNSRPIHYKTQRANRTACGSVQLFRRAS
jgi:transcriptional regulator with XRE-family HTH domain